MLSAQYIISWTSHYSPDKKYTFGDNLGMEILHCLWKGQRCQWGTLAVNLQHQITGCLNMSSDRLPLSPHSLAVEAGNDQLLVVTANTKVNQRFQWPIVLTIRHIETWWTVIGVLAILSLPVECNMTRDKRAPCVTGRYFSRGWWLHFTASKCLWEVFLTLQEKVVLCGCRIRFNVYNCGQLPWLH